MQRLFAAIELPDPVKDQLMVLGAGLPGAKWRKRDQLHLTLRFIGEVHGGVARDIDEALARVHAPDFSIALRGIGHFGDRKRPRILWTGVDSNEAVRFLNERIERALIRIGLEPERRKFKPHVTIAKLSGTRMHQVEHFEAQHMAFETAPFRVEKFTLFSSFLASDGAIYTPEADYGLEPTATHRDVLVRA
jgi:2'-5' RNA ligase